MIETDVDGGETKRNQISESNKKKIILTLCFLAICDFSGYSLPITSFPALASQRGLNSTLTGFIFSLFPFGGFFTSFISGKLMRFYKKYNLLLFFLTLTCLSKIMFGFAYYVEDETLFIIVSAISRTVLGFSFSAYQPIAMSHIPEIWPESVVKHLSYFEICLNCGLFIGPIFGSMLSLFTNYFWTFFIASTLHFVCGLFMIMKVLRIKEIPQFSEKNETPLNIWKMVKSGSLVVQFCFQALFLGGIMFIYSDFENHVLSLGGTQIESSLIYGLNMIGFFTGLFIINNLHKPNGDRRVWFLCGSILLIIFNNFFGPAPFLNITDNDDKLISISIAFYVVGIAMAIIIPLIVPEYIDILRGIYPDEKIELLIDMGPALYISSYSMIEFLATILGGLTIDNLGFDWANVVYAGVLCVFFVIYWGKRIFCENRKEYQGFENEMMEVK